MSRRLKTLLWGLALEALVLPALAAQETPTWAPVTLPEARQHDLQAQSGKAYRIFIAAPNQAPPPAGHPVLYVLDGNAAFPVAAFLARSAADRSEITGLTPPIVVGIGYPNSKNFDGPARRRDYTVASGEPEDGVSEGGAEDFLDFIETELKPLIAARHPVNPERQALFGHSFGGLLVVHALLTRPDSFSTFLASSPSLWWKEQRVLEKLPQLLESNARPRVQISVGTLEDDPPKGNYPPEMRAMIAQRQMIPPARQLAAQLRQAPGWENRLAYYELAGEDHGLVWLPALSRGVQFFLEQP